MKPNFFIRFLSVVFVAPIFCAVMIASGQNAVVKSEFIFEKAPFPSCHASTIVETKSGLVAAWFGGTAERNPDVCIYVSRNENGTWTPPMQVADGVGFATNRLPTWNPVLFQPKNGPLLLFYKVGPKPAAWWGMMTTSSDEGKTWSKPVRLPDGILGPIKNKPVQLANGDILCGSSIEGDGWKVHFERTSDFGKTWTATPPVNDGKKSARSSQAFYFCGTARSKRSVARVTTNFFKSFRRTMEKLGVK
jgi:predicted neuraminidase